MTSIRDIRRRIGRFIDRCGFLARHGEHVALVLLIVVVSIINIAWINQDTRPQPDPDPHIYLIRTFEFLDRLRRGGQFWHSFTRLSMGGGRPPLYQLLSAPFVYLLGRSADAAVSVNIVFGAILLLSTYGIGRLAENGRAGLLAALVVATYPPIVGLSRIYRPHSATPACAALSLWLLLLLLKTRSRRVAWIFGASLGFGMLIHVYFVLALAVPTVLVGLYMLLFQNDPRHPSRFRDTPSWLITKLSDPFVLFGLMPAAVIAAGLTATWYLPQSRELFTYRESVAAGHRIETRGFPGIPHSFWWYALTAPGTLSQIFVILLGIGLVVGTIGRQLGRSMLVIAFLAVYTCFGLDPFPKGWFIFAPVLPIAAALTAVGAVGIRDFVFFARAGRSRIVRVAGVDGQQGTVDVAGLHGGALTLRLPADAALSGRIKRGTALRITPRIDAPADRSSSGPSGSLLDELEPTRCVVQLAPGTRIAGVLSTALTFICLAVGIFNFSVVTWGVGSWSRPIAIALGAPLGSSTCNDSPMNVALCPNPARTEDWRASDILRVILEDPECRARQCHLVIVPRLSTFELTGFVYHLVRDFPDSFDRLKVSRPGWKLGGDAYNARWLTSDYLVYIPQVATGRKIRFALTRFLESAAPLFADAHQEVASFSLPDGLTARLIKRTAPLTLEEARSSIAALDISEEGKSVMLHKVQEQIQDGAVDRSQAAGEIEPGDKMNELTPRHVRWSLASNLSAVQAYSDKAELIWWLDGTWGKPYPYDQDVLVGPSTVDVEGLVRADQVHFHPFSADQNTYVRFDVKDCQYDAFQIGHGLADQVAGLSNGVRYTLQASLDGGDSYEALWDEVVMDSVWRSETLPLAAYRGRDVTFQLAVDAMGDDDHDWLQTTVHLLPAVDE